MNIYEFRINGEKEWICAWTLIEALQFYSGLTDISLIEFDDKDDIILVPKEQWKDMNIVNPNELDEQGNPVVTETFEEYMKGKTDVDIIATTVY